MNNPQNQDPATVEQGTVDRDAVTQSNANAPQPAATATRAATTQGTVGEDTGFLPDDRMSALRDRWNDVQAGFVDDPQNAVQQAHGLVTQLVDELVQTFTQERTSLEGQWKSGGSADTEQLRVALQRYRSFFNRLLGT